MLRLPAPSDMFSEGSPLPASRDSTSVTQRSLVMLPRGTSCIGRGAFGTVRLGWVQERKCRRRRDGTTAPKILLGACAAVAVKRVAIPDATNIARSYRRVLLLRELRLMERIRMHPHPNVVQCWGFLFGAKDGSSQPLSQKDATDAEEASMAGTVLTSLSKERQPLKGEASDEDDDESLDEVDNCILDGASYVDLCLSLCTGGSLANYVNRKATEASRGTSSAADGGSGEVHTFASSGPKLNMSANPSEKTDIEPISAEHGLTEGMTGDASSCVCGYPSASHTEDSQPVLGSGEVEMAQSEASEATSTIITAQLAVRERHIVAVAYALVNALRHTHEILRTLHRDVKPSNVLICSGIGKTPEYAMQSSSFSSGVSDNESNFKRGTIVPSGVASPRRRGGSNASETTSSSEDSVEFSLFSELPVSAGDVTQPERSYSGKETPTASGEPPPVLVVPLSAGRHRAQCAAESPQPVNIEYLPQADGWRIQLADFGVTTGVGRLSGTGRCGTFPFMAPEVVGNRACMHAYGTAADVYSVGVTLQHMLVHLVVGNGEANPTARRCVEALGAQWVDEDDIAGRSDVFPVTAAGMADSTTGAGVSENATTDARPQFVVPNAWRCDRELDEQQYIRSAPRGLGGRSAKTAQDNTKDNAEETPLFAVPRSWRCRNELLEGEYIRRGHAADGGGGAAHEYLLADLPNNPSDMTGLPLRAHRRNRCKSCRRIHRSLVELLNAMTETQPSQRPPLSKVLQSAAIIEHGEFMGTTISSRSHGGGDSANEDAAPLFPMERRAAGGPFMRARQRAAKGRAGDSAWELSFTTAGNAKNEENSSSRSSSSDGKKTPSLLWRPPSLTFLRVSDGGVGVHRL